MTDPKDPKGPVLIDLAETATSAGDGPALTPATAPPVPDSDVDTSPVAAAVATRTAAGASLGGWVLGLGGTVLLAAVGVAAWGTLEAALARSALLGVLFGLLLAAFFLACLLIALREVVALSRLAQVERLRTDAAQALEAADLRAARVVATRLAALYRSRNELRGAAGEVTRRVEEGFDPDGVLRLAETQLLAPLDTLARREVETAARKVATVTALVPLALADLAVALTANLRMIRRIAEIYGGRAGTLGSWRLVRGVVLHLMATGALAVGDDLIGSIAGGGVMSRISRRFGEGVVNGALSARIGLAAMEVCRPLPFLGQSRPSVTGTVQRALAGLFTGRGEAG